MSTPQATDQGSAVSDSKCTPALPAVSNNSRAPTYYYEVLLAQADLPYSGIRAAITAAMDLRDSRKLYVCAVAVAALRITHDLDCEFAQQLDDLLAILAAERLEARERALRGGHAR